MSVKEIGTFYGHNRTVTRFGKTRTGSSQGNHNMSDDCAALLVLFYIRYTGNQ